MLATRQQCHLSCNCARTITVVSPIHRRGSGLCQRVDLLLGNAHLLTHWNCMKKYCNFTAWIDLQWRNVNLWCFCQSCHSTTCLGSTPTISAASTEPLICMYVSSHMFSVGTTEYSVHMVTFWLAVKWAWLPNHFGWWLFWLAVECTYTQMHFPNDIGSSNKCYYLLGPWGVFLQKCSLFLSACSARMYNSN